MKSYVAKPDEIGGEWHVIDASDKILGRMAVEIATILMGKHRPTYTAHVLTGDVVVVVNAEKVKLTGRKMEQKEYDHYTYYPSGRKVVSIAQMMERHPDRVIGLPGPRASACRPAAETVGTDQGVEESTGSRTG
jgi:large subunit ribosomal protein L13